MRQDKEKVKNGLKEAITLLCKTTLQFSSELSVEGLLGITLDKDEVFLVNINEIIKSPFNFVASDLTTKRKFRSDNETVIEGDDQLYSAELEQTLQRDTVDRDRIKTPGSSRDTSQSSTPKSETRSNRRPRKQERPFIVLDCEDGTDEDIDDMLPVAKMPKVESRLHSSDERVGEDIAAELPYRHILPSPIRKLSCSPHESRNFQRTNSSSSESNNVNRTPQRSSDIKSGNFIHDNIVSIMKDKKDDDSHISRTPSDSKSSTPTAAHSNNSNKKRLLSFSTSELENFKAEDLSMKSCQLQKSPQNLVTVMESPSNVVIVKKEKIEEEEEDDDEDYGSFGGHEHLPQGVMNISGIGIHPGFSGMALPGMAQMGHSVPHLSALQVGQVICMALLLTHLLVVKSCMTSLKFALLDGQMPLPLSHNPLPV